MTRDDDPPAPGPARPGTAAYERAKRLASSPDPGQRADVAMAAESPPEILYFLADDDTPEVRRAVAHHPATPMQATPRLARDKDTDVRVLLARKLARALPHLTAEEQAAMRDIAHHALGLLAVDQVTRVRAAVASALRDVAVAPPALIASLARDIARDVAEPILQGCLAISDAELVSIIAAHPAPWVLEAIARRTAVTAGVADAIAASGDRVAVATLLANPGAHLSEQGIKALVADHLPTPDVAAKPLLPPSLLARLTGIVEDSVRGEMAAHGFDRAEGREVVAVTQRRLDWARDYVKREDPEGKALRLKAEGRLSEEVIWDALSWGDRAFIRAALALRADLPADIVQRIIDTQSARAITALAWRAGLTMRCARLLQLKSGLPPTKLLNARDGIDYPMTEDQLRWQLSLFGIE